MRNVVPMADSRPSGFRLAHSLLLSRFVSPSAPHLDIDARSLSGWTAALKELPNSAIERFKEEALLVPFEPSNPRELSQGLANIYNIGKLKEMLKRRALKVSGRKDELIARLVNADRDGLLREVATLGLYHCSDAGRKLASRFEERKECARANAVAAMNAKDYTLAIREYQEIEDDLGFPKWEFEGPARPDFIQLVMTVSPRILDGCSEEIMSRLRLAMSLQCVAGRHAPQKLFRGIETGIRLNADTCATMIYFLARHTEDLQKWKQMGIVYVTHLAITGSCSVCTSLNGRKWRIDHAPELPHVQCVHQCGCRCLYQPIPQRQ